MTLLAMLTMALLSLSAASRAVAADDFEKNAQWITGDVLIKDSFLFFRTDKPVQGNQTGDLVLLGTTKVLARSMLPLLMRAGERSLKLRLYGVLMPAARRENMPDVQFIVWKLHSPGDPDVLPPGEAIRVDGETALPGYKVEIPKEE